MDTCTLSFYDSQSFDKSCRSVHLNFSLALMTPVNKIYNDSSWRNIHLDIHVILMVDIPDV